MNTLTKEGIGLAVKTLRRQAKLTQTGLAEQAGLTASAISRIELGEAELWFIDCVAVTKILKISLEEFVAFAEKLETDEIRKARERLLAQNAQVRLLRQEIRKRTAG